VSWGLIGLPCLAFALMAWGWGDIRIKGDTAWAWWRFAIGFILWMGSVYLILGIRW
jgi:hypothetical protein